jgi:hypothetical protein
LAGIPGELIVALDNEIRTAVGLLKHGLAGLQAIDPANDFYQLPLLLLANGSERLCKCVLILKHEKDHGGFPSQAVLKKLGHDVRTLTDTIQQECYPAEYLKRQVAVGDQAFLHSDVLLQEVIACLSHYGSGGRYYDLDLISGEKPAGESPESAWQRLEMTIMQSDSNLKAMLSDPRTSNKLYEAINMRLQVTLERYFRALCHLFTLGPISEEGKRFTGAIGDFLFLRDDQLGTRDYGQLLWRPA